MADEIDAKPDDTKIEPTTVQDQAPDPEKFVSKERYDELRRQLEAKEATDRALYDQQPQQAQTQAPGVLGDAEIAAYARQTGLSIEEARQWADTAVPLINHYLQQQYASVAPIIGGLADKVAELEAMSSDDVGTLYKENRRAISKLRADAVRNGQYLSPENALQIVLAKNMMDERTKAATESNNSAVTNRAKGASDEELRSSRGGSPGSGPASAADIAKLSPEDRIKFFEDSADKGESF